MSYPSSTSTNITPFCTPQLLILLVPFWLGLVFTFVAGIFGAALHPVIPLTDLVVPTGVPAVTSNRVTTCIYTQPSTGELTSLNRSETLLSLEVLRRRTDTTLKKAYRLPSKYQLVLLRLRTGWIII